MAKNFFNCFGIIRIIERLIMHITPINHLQINNAYGLKRNNKVYNKNTSVSFGNLKHKVNNIAPVLGAILGTIVFTPVLISKCSGSQAKSELIEHTDEYYDSVRTQHHIAIYQNGDSEYVPTQKEFEQIERMNNRMDTLVKEFPSGTPERETIERIYNNELDKISAGESDRGREITPNEEGQVIIDLRDSINTLYPDRKVNIII